MDSDPDAPRCLNCGYMLDDLPEPRCPECGRAFDPRDPRTYWQRRPVTGNAWLLSAALGAGAAFIGLIFIQYPAFAIMAHAGRALLVAGLVTNIITLVRSAVALVKTPRERNAGD